jgi:signal peptidase I
VRKKPSAHLIWAVIFLGVTIVFLGAFKIIIVSGFSMAPKYHDGQALLMTRCANKVRYDDIIVIKQEDQGEVIKRVIGLPGDVINLKNGLVLRNDIILAPYTSDAEIEVVYVLGEDEYFVIGDNYQDSIDSRQFGPVTRDNLLGKIVSIDGLP